MVEANIQWSIYEHFLIILFWNGLERERGVGEELILFSFSFLSCSFLALYTSHCLGLVFNIGHHPHYCTANHKEGISILEGGGGGGGMKEKGGDGVVVKGKATGIGVVGGGGRMRERDGGGGFGGDSDREGKRVIESEGLRR